MKERVTVAVFYRDKEGVAHSHFLAKYSRVPSIGELIQVNKEDCCYYEVVKVVHRDGPSEWAAELYVVDAPQTNAQIWHTIPQSK